MNDPFDPVALLNWYVEMGVDECIADDSLDRYALSEELLARRKAASAQPAPSKTPLAPPLASPPSQQQEVHATDELVHRAVELAQNAKTLEELHQAVLSFDGCALKATAMNTVFGEGNPKAAVMFLGDTPGTDEDRTGKIFCGAAGQLLDKMLHSCGLESEIGLRSDIYLSNIAFWRPPGNRPPTPSEIALCLPFVERHIELVNPKIIVLLGGAAAKALLGRHEAISKLRGRWFEHATPGLARPVQVIALYHPESLLRSPAQKRRVWGDLLSLKDKLSSL